MKCPCCGLTGPHKSMVSGCVPAVRARITELEAGLSDALIDCEFSMEPKLHSDLKALLGEDTHETP